MSIRRRSASDYSPDEDKAGLENTRHGFSTSNKGLVWSPDSIRRLSHLKAFLKRNTNQILLTCVPLGILAGHMQWSAQAVFILNLLAMVPLAAILSSVTEELATNAGQTIGALLNATFGNAPELIVVHPMYCIPSFQGTFD